MMTPAEAIVASPPNVWLTSFYGFNPSSWGFLGFSNKGQRDHFVRETKPGALVVIYGHKSKAPKEQRGQIIGIQQVSHRVNFAKAFMDPVAWATKEADAETMGKWDLAVKATRAWHVAPESYALIDHFADETYTSGRAQVIGSLGMRLTAKESQKLFDLILVETSVFGEIEVDAASPVQGSILLQPSKPGPVSQNGYFTRESEGPKQLYILKLNGDRRVFLGKPTNGQSIIKVGFSVSPLSRRDGLNAALPAGLFSWTALHSNDLEGEGPYPSSKHALAGESEMKRLLVEHGDSLGGEFFLASPSAIQTAWDSARKVSKGISNA
ncbi:hypothetical protein RNZ50_26155 [Paracoccaceae bacterium Fryx2]|nr:hypothetical protein [Paracoccaceae bacterium Fryx2]